jgi:septum site-determining protein MinC
MNKQNFSTNYFVIDNSDIDVIKQNIANLENGKYEPVVIDIIDTNFPVVDLPIIIELFAQKQLIVVGIKTTSSEVLEFARFSNLAIFPSKTNFVAKQTDLFTNRPSIIRGDVKNNEQIYVKNTDLVILGDVGSGSEVISDKNIYIYGGSYGKIFAGITDKSAKIFINFFATKLVCINGIYREFDKTPKEYLNKSIEISLIDNKLDFKILL